MAVHCVQVILYVCDETLSDAENVTKRCSAELRNPADLKKHMTNLHGKTGSSCSFHHRLITPTISSTLPPAADKKIKSLGPLKSSKIMDPSTAQKVQPLINLVCAKSQSPTFASDRSIQRNSSKNMNTNTARKVQPLMGLYTNCLSAQKRWLW
jgi:hypothetical protein